MTARTCDLCGAAVTPVRRAGRTHDYRKGLSLPVPEDFPLLTCTQCGEEYFTADDLEALERAQQPAFRAWQTAHLGRVVAHIRELHPELRLRDLERACGVTGTYLSHVLRGTKDASQMLVNLLESFSLNPAELRRKLEGASWEDARAQSRAVAQRPTSTFDFQPVVAAPSVSVAPRALSAESAAAHSARRANVIPFPRKPLRNVDVERVGTPAKLPECADGIGV